MTEVVVLDVSAAAEAVMQRPQAPVILEKLEEAEIVLAPSLYHFEATNVFWKYHCHHDIPLPQSEKSLHQVIDLVDEFVPAEALFEEVFQLACLVEHVTYDLFYLAVALREAGLLITLDQDLQNLARKRGVETLPD